MPADNADNQRIEIIVSPAHGLDWKLTGKFD